MLYRDYYLLSNLICSFYSSFFLINFFWRIIALQNFVAFVKPQHESAIGIYIYPLPFEPPSIKLLFWDNCWFTYKSYYRVIVNILYVASLNDNVLQNYNTVPQLGYWQLIQYTNFVQISHFTLSNLYGFSSMKFYHIRKFMDPSP